MAGWWERLRHWLWAPPRTLPDDEPLAEVVELAITDELDLHHFAPDQTADAVRDYLEAAHGKGLLRVRLVHGKGIGVQRSIVRSVLSAHPLVARFSDDPGQGSWGATVVELTEEEGAET